MNRIVIFIYGLVSYALFLGVFLYALGFVGDFGVPKTIDAPHTSTGPLPAMAVNLALLLAFGLQHSVMARPTFKNWWTKFIPQPAERSTYVLASNICMIAMFVLWQPMPAIVWHVEDPVWRGALWAVFATGWLLVLITTFLINHFDLFGLRQVWLHLRGHEYTHLPFATPLLYRYIRHPLYVGWITAFWATPTMTMGHMLFASVTTAYILIAIVFEERNLTDLYGHAYEDYVRGTGKFLPRLRPQTEGTGTTTSIEPV